MFKCLFDNCTVVILVSYGGTGWWYGDWGRVHCG